MLGSKFTFTSFDRTETSRVGTGRTFLAVYLLQPTVRNILQSLKILYACWEYPNQYISLSEK